MNEYNVALECYQAFVHLWHGAASKNPLENGEAPSHNHVIADVLHDAGGLARHQRQQDGSCGADVEPCLSAFAPSNNQMQRCEKRGTLFTFVEVPEEE